MQSRAALLRAFGGRAMMTTGTDSKLIVLITLSSFVVLISCINVTYDSRSLIIDGKRRFLQSGAIHYPRSTPDMWPTIINTAKEGGLDAIESYIFWSVHEPEKGKYNFEERNDLIRFVKTVGDAGLYMILRIGPYVCAEWSFGGFPVWLRNVPGIEFRIANKPFYDEMQRMANWGQGRPHRPAEDLAFAVARFFEKGGSLQNYYMYYGGSNFGRWAGIYVTTSYDYDAPIDEYGQPNQPKWGHLKDLHAAIKLCEPALASAERTQIPTSDVKIEIDIYANVNGQRNSTIANYEEVVKNSTLCAAFLANTYDNQSVLVEFNGESYNIPPWSVTILPDCKTPTFNTAQIKAATSTVIYKPETSSGQWEYYSEPVGMWDSGSGSINSTFKADGMVEQLGVTSDRTDYLWYITSVNMPGPSNGMLELELRNDADTVHIFVNGALVGADSFTFNNFSVVESVSLLGGDNVIALLSMPVGLQNAGAHYENVGRGIEQAILSGRVGNISLGDQEWTYQVGSQGEFLELYTEQGAANVHWQALTGNATSGPLTWYKTLIESPAGSKPVALDLRGMGRGQAWINGHGIGRFWSIKNTEGSWGVYDEECDYRGSFFPSKKCRTELGQPSQGWYHVPRAWLKPAENLLVLYEEIGGDPRKVTLSTRERV